MRLHPVPVQFDQEEKIIGGKLTFKQIGFLTMGFLAILASWFLLFFLPWFLRLILTGFILYQAVKFTFFGRLQWDYFTYWLKLRRCKKRQNHYVYRKSTRK